MCTICDFTKGIEFPDGSKRNILGNEIDENKSSGTFLYIGMKDNKHYIYAVGDERKISFEIFHCPVCGRKLGEVN